MRLPPTVRAEAKRLVDRCYAAFGTMFDALCAADARQVPVIAAGVVTAPAVQVRPSPRLPKVDIPFVTVPARQIRVRT